MTRANSFRRLAVRLFAVLAMFSGIAEGQVQRRVAGSLVPSLSESGQALTIRTIAPQTGFATFANSTDGGLLLPIEAGAPAQMRAFKFIELYGASFGIADSKQMKLLRAPHKDRLGIDHVRLQQVHEGVLVRGAELIVHMAGSRVLVANGHTTDDLPASVMPTLAPAAARAIAQRLIEKHRPGQAKHANYSEPRLEILNRSLLSDTVNYHSRLAWFIEATGPALRQYIWIDSQSGVLLLDFSQLAESKSRQVYNGNHTSTLPGTLVRSEGGAATGDADQDNAYAYAGIAYDYYLTNHGRDSFDNAGSTIISTAHHCPEGYPQGSTCPEYQNAAWTGSQMIYADGFASADDVVGHELTHAVTEYSADLFYYMQSGALNESFSDIFGETIDLTDGVGNDASNVRWKLGEELPGGATRDMLTPTTLGDPGKMSDSAYFVCTTSSISDGTGDRGGVHSNSGIPNHAYALMVDGGTYNDTTITGIGLTKAAEIEYRALTVYLTSGSGFIDDFNALNQSCTDLIGTVGITSADCTQVTKALQAVEIGNTWGCSGATKVPPLCSTGTPSSIFLDTFETVTSNWTITSSFGSWNAHSTGFARGTYMAYGEDPDDVSDHRLTETSAITIPSGARIYFDHAFEFENEFFNYDGGAIEYSTNNGSTWSDAGGLIDAGQSYNGFVDGGNALGGRSAFVNSSYGYTGTRLNLASLSGQSVKLRFRIASDISIGSLGWVVDDVTVYTCTSVPTGAFSVDDTAGKIGLINVNTETASVTGNSGVMLTDVARTSSGAMYGVDFNNLYSINPSTGTATYIGALGVPDMNALVGNGTGLLAASNTSTSIYSVNTSTGAATALTGSLGYPAMGDLAFHDGFLFAAVQNGAFSDLVRVTLAGNSFTATNLGHVTSDNELFALAEGTDRNLYGVSGTAVLKINTSNPALSTVVVFNYGVSSSLAAANGAASPYFAAFTDDPLASSLSVIKAVHFTELRNRIDAIRIAKGLSTYTWTDPTLSTGSTKIKGVHLTDLRTALNQAYVAVGLNAPTYTDPSPAAVKVKALHIMEIRAAVAALE